jgi:nucleoid-associated protein YgaU
VLGVEIDEKGVESMSGLPLKLRRRMAQNSRNATNWLWAIFLILIAVTPLSCGNSVKAVRVTEIYTVEQGDTLWGIADRFMAKNTYGRRDIREFYYNILEQNQDAVFKDRGPHYLIFPGDKLVVSYWEKVEE